MSDTTYPVHEMFMTMQGEGVYLGLPAFFIRLFGCPIHCDFCDSAGTWHPNHVPKNIQRLTPTFLANAACLEKATRVVVTGGEPAIHDLVQLSQALHSLGIEVHLETSGAFPIRGEFDWITLSPKRAKAPLPQSVEAANEFKLIIEQPDDIEFYYQQLASLGMLSRSGNLRTIWLHPEWSQRENLDVLFAIVQEVKRGRRNFRAGWQLHKLYQADTFDLGSRPPVPLGGNVAKGY